jgi:hypothetical protein
MEPDTVAFFRYGGGATAQAFVWQHELLQLLQVVEAWMGTSSFDNGDVTMRWRFEF